MGSTQSSSPGASRATSHTRRRIEASAATMPWGDQDDVQDTTRGFVARATERQITDAAGNVVWDLDAYAFLRDAEPHDAPSTAHPSLWRQSRLLIEDGLFQVTEGIYQLRGFDLSVMSIVESDTGVIVIDPLVSCETAAAAFALYSEHRGNRPVKAMIYTHSHIDHFGGVKGIITQEQVDAGSTVVIAPEGFLHHAVAENVFAGPAMARRAGYMFGAALDKGPAGQIGAGLGQTTSTGTVSLIAPTDHVTHTGQEMTIDGVTIEFQVTPGTEAPAEMNFYFPERKALCTAENTSHVLHNILTLRGALVRDAHAWAGYLTETIQLFGNRLDCVFASHHWPTWDRERCVEFLGDQRDLYLYLHDQTLRLMNRGFTGSEIAEMIQVPPGLAARWHTHGYYGSVSHNVRAIYQRYMGFYDANPANLWAHPPEAAATRYVAAMGGRDGALAVAREAFEDGDYRWCAEVAKHLVFADGDDTDAKAVLADAFEQLAFGAENAIWRNAYLAGATELRNGIFGTPTQGSSDILGALQVTQIFDAMGTRIDGPAAWDTTLQLAWEVTDEGTIYLLELRNGALHHQTVERVPSGVTTLTSTRQTLIGMITRTIDAGAAFQDGSVTSTGDLTVLATLVGLTTSPDPDFAIVTP